MTHLQLKSEALISNLMTFRQVHFPELSRSQKTVRTFEEWGEF